MFTLRREREGTVVKDSKGAEDVKLWYVLCQLQGASIEFIWQIKAYFYISVRGKGGKLRLVLIKSSGI